MNPRGAPTRDREFLYQIVANTQNSIDVDKFDYLSRDCHHVGLPHSFDCARLLEFSRVIGDEICFHAKQVFNIYEMFHTRYAMHKQVYTHRFVKKCFEGKGWFACERTIYLPCRIFCPYPLPCLFFLVLR